MTPRIEEPAQLDEEELKKKSKILGAKEFYGQSMKSAPEDLERDERLNKLIEERMQKTGKMPVVDGSTSTNSLKIPEASAQVKVSKSPNKSGKPITGAGPKSILKKPKTRKHSDEEEDEDEESEEDDYEPINANDSDEEEDKPKRSPKQQAVSQGPRIGLHTDQSSQVATSAATSKPGPTSVQDSNSEKTTKPVSETPNQQISAEEADSKDRQKKKVRIIEEGPKKNPTGGEKTDKQSKKPEERPDENEEGEKKTSLFRQRMMKKN